MTGIRERSDLKKNRCLDMMRPLMMASTMDIVSPNVVSVFERGCFLNCGIIYCHHRQIDRYMEYNQDEKEHTE